MYLKKPFDLLEFLFAAFVKKQKTKGGWLVFGSRLEISCGWESWYSIFPLLLSHVIEISTRKQMNVLKFGNNALPTLAVSVFQILQNC
jgi:hypothetical protein